MKNPYLLITILLLLTHSIFAATITAIKNGNWTASSTWDLERTPANNDVVIIPYGITVMVRNTPYSKNNESLRPTLTIKISGILDFSDAGTDRLYLDVGSKIEILEGGKIQTSNHSTEIIAIYNGSYDNTVWTGSPNTISGPVYATATSSGFLNAVLPLQLISFKVVKTGNGTGKLIWMTGGEINLYYFGIETLNERDRQWKPIGTVNAAGNSNEALNYSFMVNLIPDQVNEFRLKQVDIDGKFTYSPVAAIGNNNVSEVPGMYYNSSTKALQFLNLPLKSGVRINMAIWDLNGKTILTNELTSSSYSLHLPSALPGCYIVQITGNRKMILSKKIVIH